MTLIPSELVKRIPSVVRIRLRFLALTTRSIRDIWRTPIAFSLLPLLSLFPWILITILRENWCEFLLRNATLAHGADEGRPRLLQPLVYAFPAIQVAAWSYYWFPRCFQANVTLEDAGVRVTSVARWSSLFFWFILFGFRFRVISWIHFLFFEFRLLFLWLLLWLILQCLLNYHGIGFFYDWCSLLLLYLSILIIFLFYFWCRIHLFFSH